MVRCRTHNRCPNLGVLVEDFRNIVIGVGPNVVFAGLQGKVAPVFAVMASVAICIGVFTPARPCLRMRDIWRGFLGALRMRRLSDQPHYLVPPDLQSALESSIRPDGNRHRSCMLTRHGALYVYPVIWDGEIEEYRTQADLIRMNPGLPGSNGELATLADLSPCPEMQNLLAEFVQEFGLELIA